ncbi:MAG: hypothetical protein JWR19_2166 [Pedosphaera sp.]|nr:hypothetical protein [Pedosphaera sp.]
MKKLIIASLLIVAMALPSFAQSFKPTTLNGGTNFIAATATNTYTGVTVVALRSRMVTLQPSFALTGAGTSAVTFTVNGSTDGAIYTNGITRMPVTANGTNVVSGLFTIDTGGYTFISIGTGENLNATVATNVTVNAGMKQGL